MTNKSKARHGIRRGRKFTLNPTSRAIRHAFALGLALASSGPLLAGTCDVSDPANAVCDGDFVGSNISFAIDDLTIVIGGDLPTVIQPLDGVIGIDLYSALGSIALTSAADILTSNAAAINVYAPNGDVNVESSGLLEAYYADGIAAISFNGDVNVTNDGSILATGIHGIQASSYRGDVSVDNALGATISAVNANGYAFGINASGYYGDITVVNDGAISASAVTYGNATGIRASTFGGDVSVTIGDYGSVSVMANDIGGSPYGSNGKAIGVSARSGMSGSSVENHGDINATATGINGYATAYGVLDRAGYYGAAEVVNYGTIDATASVDNGVGWAWGIRARGSEATLDNLGQVSANGSAQTGYATATGAYVRGNYIGPDTGYSSISNVGSLDANAHVYGSGTARAYGAMMFGYHSTLDNVGTISAHADSVEGTSVALGSLSYYSVDSTSNNAGSMVASSYTGLGFASSMGIRDNGFDSSTVYNNAAGNISATAEVGNGYAFAYGIWSAGGDISSVTNDGRISAQASVDAGTAYFGTSGAMARTIGINLTAEYGNAYLVNGEYGDISVQSDVAGDIGRSYAFGTVVHGLSLANLVNQGSISAVANASNGYATSLGDIAYGTSFAVNLNYGSISANATVAGQGYAAAIGQYAFGEVSTLINEGSVSASANAGFGGATATGANLYGAYLASYNYGDISATASTVVGNAAANGISSKGVMGSSIYNAADGVITASAEVVVGDVVANGVYNYVYAYGAYVTNAGSIESTASAYHGNASATGSANIAYLLGDAVTINNGDISATATSSSVGNAQANGIYNYSYLFLAEVDNEGSISAAAYAHSGDAIATAVENISMRYGPIVITNHGDISAIANSGGGGKAQAVGVNSYGVLSGLELYNEGSILASATGQGYATAVGVASKFYDGVAVVENHGDINAVATSLGGAYGAAQATGISVAYASGKYNLPAVTLNNYSDITATATRHGVYGYAEATGVSVSVMYSEQHNYGNISAVAIADGNYSGARATGSMDSGKYGVTDFNQGLVSASASTDHGGSSTAIGSIGYSFYGTVEIHNYGDVTADSVAAFDGAHAGYAYALGMVLHADLSSYLLNESIISSEATADHGSASARGVMASGKYDVVTVVNNGDISAIANAYAGLAQSRGMRASSKYGASVVNNGTISSAAYADYYGNAQATGIMTQAPGAHGYIAVAIGAQFYNYGDITAVAHADGGFATAVGARTEGAQDAGALTYNVGTISADASAAGGYAFATGVKTWSYYGDVSLTNSGDISATSLGGADGNAVAAGSITLSKGFGPPSYHAGYVNVDNAGGISATALTTGVGYSFSTAVNAEGELGTNIYNGGSITANATAGTGDAQARALIANSPFGDVTIDNVGTISATANGGLGSGSAAFAVVMGAYGSNLLTNSGSIIATGTNAGHFAVYSNANAVAGIYNDGSITGSIHTGNLDDTLINNAGATLRLLNDTVDLGTYAALGNTFVNDGEIIIRGAYNQIDMGQGLYSSLVPSLNPIAFYNSGMINFLDGQPDDNLTIVGDFSGAGAINVDVSGLNNSSDVLYIDGSVVDGTTQTINVNLLDLPTTALSAITIVSVSGNSTVGDFVLGDVVSPSSFLDLGLSLQSTVDASNANADQFALAVDVLGLSDAGVLAASIAPGAESLMNTQVGTWRQRMGVIDKVSKGGLSLWARLFQTKGSIAPDHVSNFGSAGDFEFEQKNSGMEAGVDFAINDQFSAGLLLTKADASQNLQGNGVGNSKINGDTYGLYGTWIAPTGWYLDGSYRKMNFTAKMNSAAGLVQADGDANSFNLEAGYAWTLTSGLQVEPQFQYTHTQVNNIQPITLGQAELQVDDGTSSTGRLGVMIRKSFAATAGGTVWTPYASINAVREFDGNNSYSINGDFMGSTSVEGTSALVEGGFNAQTGNLSVYGGLNWQDGGALKTFFGGQLGIRYTWGHSQ